MDFGSATDPKGFLSSVRDSVGQEWVNYSEDTIRRYGENTLPGGDREPLCVIYPSNTSEIQAVVAAANRFRVPIFPISNGQNMGLGSRSPVHAGCAVVDLGRRMNRILSIDQTLGYAVIEPGVTFQMLHDELQRLGDHLMISTTSGPPQGSVLGNALEKGGGYGIFPDHFGALCGMEVVLGTGEVLRTGDGGLDQATSPNWHVSKYSFGPILDGLFAQSNYGVVSRSGIWLAPRPPAIRSFHFAFEADEDLAVAIDLVRPLKLNNFVPTLMRVMNDLYLVGAEEVNPEFASSSGTRSISEPCRRALRNKHGVGSWNVSGAFYGASQTAMQSQVDRVRKHFELSGKARFIDHEEALSLPCLRPAIDAFSGRPSTHELGLLKWRPGGGSIWFTPGTPMIGSVMNDCQVECRAIHEKYGLDFAVMNVSGGRFARGLHSMAFNREDPDECRRADACYRECTEVFFRRGISVGRSPTQHQEFHMEKLSPSFVKACRDLKSVFDPNSILAPGRYGI